MPRGWAAARVLAALTMTASCASTVQVSSSLQSPGAAQTVGPGSSGRDGTAAAQPDSIATASAPSFKRGPGAAGLPTLSQSGPAEGTVSTGSGGGVAGGSIKIGFEVGSADAYLRALGVSGLSTGDTRNQVAALVAYLNAHGGLGGRRIDPLLYTVPTPDNGTSDAQAECAYFTQDHHVFAVLGAGAGSSLNLFTCLAKAKTIYIDGYGSQDQAAAAALRGYWYDPADFVLDRFARMYVDQLVTLGFFSPGAKIGLLSYDDPSFRAVVSRVVQPALAAHGLKITDQALFDKSSYASQGPEFALRFRADGITHVLNLVAGVVVFFQQAAENQQYRPRYALSSRDGPGAWVQVLAPAAQLKSSLGVGWQPLADVDLAHSPGDVSPNQTLCRRIMTAAGEDMSNQGVQVASHRYCETAFFLHAAMRLAAAVSAAGFMTGVRQLAASYSPVTTFRTYFGSGRPDGPDQVRPFTFQGTCSCFVYSGPKLALSRAS